MTFSTLTASVMHLVPLMRDILQVCTVCLCVYIFYELYLPVFVRRCYFVRLRDILDCNVRVFSLLISPICPVSLSLSSRSGLVDVRFLESLSAMHFGHVAAAWLSPGVKRKCYTLRVIFRRSEWSPSTAGSSVWLCRKERISCQC